MEVVGGRHTSHQTAAVALCREERPHLGATFDRDDLGLKAAVRGDIDARRRRRDLGGVYMSPTGRNRCPLAHGGGGSLSWRPQLDCRCRSDRRTARFDRRPQLDLATRLRSRKAPDEGPGARAQRQHDACGDRDGGPSAGEA